MVSKEFHTAVVIQLQEIYFPIGSGRVGYIHLEFEEWPNGRAVETEVRAIELIKWRGVENTRNTIDGFGLLTSEVPTMDMILAELVRPGRVPST